MHEVFIPTYFLDNHAGFGFKYHNKETLELKEAFSKKLIEAKKAYPDSYVLVINHAPIFISTFEKEGVDLSVHGHTHKGQFWPNNYMTKIVYGDYYYGHNMLNNLNVVTTNGVGVATIHNRLFNRPEIVIVTFTKKI